MKLEFKSRKKTLEDLKICENHTLLNNQGVKPKDNLECTLKQTKRKRSNTVLYFCCCEKHWPKGNSGRKGFISSYSCNPSLRESELKRGGRNWSVDHGGVQLPREFPVSASLYHQGPSAQEGGEESLESWALPHQSLRKCITVCLQVNLKKAISQLRFLIPDSSMSCQAVKKTTHTHQNLGDTEKAVIK